MTNILLFLTWLALCSFWTSCCATTVYVSQDGIDSALCGDEAAPCGTLWQASVLINTLRSNSTSFITVVDGQNEAEIARHLSAEDTSRYDPCLAEPFSVGGVDIFFDANSITTMADWYPSVCPESNTMYSNEFMFEGGLHLRLTNLIVSDYVIADDVHYPLMRGTGFNGRDCTDYGCQGEWYFNASVACTDCVFRNITSSITNPEKPLINGVISVYLDNTHWTDVVSSTSLVYTNAPWSSGAVEWSNAERRVFFTNSVFTNVETTEAVLYIHYTSAEFNEIAITDCTFTEIRNRRSMIIADTIFNNIELSRSSFSIELGSLLTSFHITASTWTLADLTIATSQRWEGDLEFPLLRVSDVDVVTMTDVHLLYTYNVTDGCLVSDGAEYSNLTTAGVWYHEYRCQTPIPMLVNRGEVTMRDCVLDADFTQVPSFDASVRYNFQFAAALGGASSGFSTLFQSYNVLNLENFHVRRSVSRYLFENYGTFNVVNFTTYFDEDEYDPGALATSALLTNWGGVGTGEMFVDQSAFRGFKQWAVFVLGADMHVTNSVFDVGGQPVVTSNTFSTVMENCSFTRIGYRFFGGLTPAYSWTMPFLLLRTLPGGQITLANNFISGFDPHGLITSVYGSGKLLLVNNTIEMNDEGVLPVLDFYPKELLDTRSPVTMLCEESEDESEGPSEIIDNVFTSRSSNFDASKHWLLYDGCRTDYHGVSGNTFSNAAIKAVMSHVTSCFRPELIECLDIEYGDCAYNSYGEMNVSLRDVMQYFVVSEQVSSILHVENGSIALDNANITVAGVPADMVDPVRVKAVNGSVLLVDSFISDGDDIWYNPDECTILHHNRLRADEQIIAKLQIECGDGDLSALSDPSALAQTTESGALQIIDTLSVMAIAVESISAAYYPGGLLQVSYEVMDAVGNLIVDFESTSGLTIRLEGRSFLTDLEVEPDGECSQCEHGVLINLLEVSKHIGDTFTLQVSIVPDVLISLNSEIALNITGCPPGKGPDENNASCIQCNNGYFSTKEVSVEECLSCDPSANTGVSCADGDIFVFRDHWMGFPSSDNASIISAFCPTGYCCQHAGGCKYNDAENHAVGGVLCAKNRDPSTRLCGSCLEGYSEAMNSPKCVECDGNHLEFLLLPILSCAALTLLVFFCSTEPRGKSNDQHVNANKEVVAPKNMWQAMVTVRYFQFMIRTMVLKNIFYYEQAVTQMLTTSTYRVLFRDLAAQFELSATRTVFDADEDALWCFVDGLGAKGKILVDLLTPALVFTMVTVVFVVSRYIMKRPLGFCSQKKQINFGKAYITSFLILIGKVLDVLFKLMSCQHVGGGEFAHYYFGYETCYETSWWLAFMSMLIIVAVFTVLFVHLQRMGEAERQSRSNALNRFVSRYKPKYWYWEYAIFVRRIIIAFFAVSVQDITAKFFFAGFLIMITFVQYKIQPFKVQESNELESLLLCFLVFIQVTRVSSMFNPVSVNVVVSILIIAPFLLLVYYVRHIYTTKVIGGANGNDSLPAASASMSSIASVGADFAADADVPGLNRVTSDSGLAGRTVDVEMQAAANSETDGVAPTTAAAVDNEDDEQP